MIGGAAVAIAAAGGAWYATQQPSTTSIAAVSPDEDIDTSGILEMSLGSEDAPVTLIEYASFTCIHCARFHTAVFKPLRRDYIDTGKLKFIHRDAFHDPYGLMASQIARCEPTRFFGIADILFNTRDEWIGDQNPAGMRDRLRKIGLVAGLEPDQLDACINDEEMGKTLLAWYQKNAVADNVEGTPTLIINGQKYENMNYQDLKAVIDAKLEG